MVTPEIIHDPSKRVYAKSIKFERGIVTNICLLDFLGSPDCFVTDFGVVWNRNEFHRVKNNELIFRNYYPLVVRDKYYQVPWVMIPVGKIDVWYPIDLIVGWAFKPTTDKSYRYFTYKKLGYSCQVTANSLVNSNTLTLPNESIYKNFIDVIYM